MTADDKKTVCNHRNALFIGQGKPVGANGERYMCGDCGAEAEMRQGHLRWEGKR
jgi:hypothetical protein